MRRLTVDISRTSPWKSAEVAELLQEIGVPRDPASAAGALLAAAMDVPKDAAAARNAELRDLATVLAQYAEDLDRGTSRAGAVAEIFGLTAYEVRIAARVLSTVTGLVRQRMTDR